jgi:hypothetical protein
MYRDELDALNALHQEQLKTNALLEMLVSALTQEEQKEAAEDAPKRRGGRNNGKGS